MAAARSEVLADDKYHVDQRHRKKHRQWSITQTSGQVDRRHSGFLGDVDQAALRKGFHSFC